MESAIALTLILAGLALWAASLRAREHALGATKRSCRELGVELLDETVELAELGVDRNTAGRLRLRRRFTFEFTADGRTRRRGWALLLGGQLESLQFEFPEGLTILDRGSDRQFGVRA